MARTYKRDSNGRFAGGGGGSGGGGKKATSKPAGSGDGRRGPRGGKVGTKAEQARAKKAQAARTAQFHSKTQSSARDAWKKAQGEKRKGAKMAATAVKQSKQRKPKQKTANDLLTQATRIEIRGRRMSRAARTGFRDRQIETRASSAAKAARERAFEMQKPKPESKTAKAKRERAARVKAREDAVNASRLIAASRRRRR